ncbi:uncharacterized protein LY89DRAFT_702681 [Mollisia scopiformis]|uniref:Uncharacterized protein n=1 Tax=Mollisia scopiformis TaxID=149040 RepID=A0A132B3U4_MOLSC|nr:uncharacterized protein LY89DRAFT_702681 [Mollisia scopiformis]KUJ07056.1 hypothetical protein LY89DRAFT_702681 [Mollisia scopiformis]
MEGKQDEPTARPRRYNVEELKYLKDSPHVVKPPGLPPADQWMGPPADTTRNSTKAGADRNKNHDSNALLDQTPRRPGTERHISRNSANPEDIILGPPKTSFLSATPFRNTGKNFDSSDRPTLRDADSRDRFNLRSKAEGEVERTREGRNNLRPKRAEGDQDSDGWSTVKPRKSFGTEGAERFNGRMGLDRHRDDRRFKDREDRDAKDRPRGFDTFSRDNKDGGDQEQDRDSRKNGTGRGRNEPSWFRDKDTSDAPPNPRDRNSNGDRFADRSRGWRDKDRDEKVERSDRGDRRWDRDQRQEREPEWMDEPAEEKNEKNNKAHSLEEFKKWKEQMSGKDKAGKPAAEEGIAKPDAPSFFGLEKKVLTPMELDTVPDKFFGKWSTPKDEVPPELGPELKKENVVKSKPTGKASRFTSFFNQDEAPRRQTEPPAMPPQVPSTTEAGPATQQDEKQAFAMLLQKLHLGTQGGASGSTPPANPALQPRPPPVEKAQQNGLGPELFQQYRPERQEEVRTIPRNSQTLQDLQNQRQLASSQPTGRPNSAEQLLQDLVGQRQNTLSQSSARPGHPQRRDTQADFLMGLMKSAPEPQRSEQVLLGIPPKQNDRQMQQILDREQEMHRAAVQRERSASQRQVRPQPPPGFYDEQAFQRGPLPHERQPQPTQILARPPPPGLDLGWDRQPQLPPQHRVAQNIAPPPGLANGPTRMPMPQQMFPPFPMGAFPPPDVMAGPPRNMQMQPPPGFYNPPPPGFMPPGMSGFQGPDGMAFGAPFDGRGPPPQGAFRRQ